MSFYIYFRYSSASVRPGTGNADLGLLIEKLEQWSQYILDFRMRIADYCFKFFNLGNLGIL